MINVKTEKLATVDRKFWYAWHRHDSHLLEIRHVKVTSVHIGMVYKADGTTAVYNEKIDTDQALNLDRRDLYNNMTAMARDLWKIAAGNYEHWCHERSVLMMELGELNSALSEPPAGGSFGNQRKLAEDLINRMENMYRRLELAKAQCLCLCVIMSKRMPYPEFRDTLKGMCANETRKLFQKVENEYEKHLHRLAVRGFDGKKEDK